MNGEWWIINDEWRIGTEWGMAGNGWPNHASSSKVMDDIDT